MSSLVNYGFAEVHSISVTPNFFLSPLKQFKAGIPAEHVECKKDLQLVIKATDGSPACIKQESISKLIQRSWIKTEKIQFENYAGELSYYFNEGKVLSAQIFGLKRDAECVGPGCGFEYTGYTILTIDAKSGGLLILAIPREVIGTTRDLAGSQFVVLVGPQEAGYLDASNSTHSILGLKIPSNVTTVEIFSFGNYNPKLPPYSVVLDG